MYLVQNIPIIYSTCTYYFFLLFLKINCIVVSNFAEVIIIHIFILKNKLLSNK